MFRFGVDYYPEHWPEERWQVDAQLMAEAGFNVVRLAEFAWSKMEPVEGQYEFDWLDRALSTLSAHNIQAILGTPTASPPPWLMTKYPNAYRVREDGRRLTYGNRREYCPNSPVYQELSRRIVTQMAEHYTGHPAVIGWQIDNEFGDRCYCPACAMTFQAWLRKRYASLEELNEQWGTVFWSHIYNDWSEIPVPKTTGGSPNPGLALDFYRFSSDSYVAYQKMQVEILRQRCPQHFITHNFMGFSYDRINYYDLAKDLDFVAWDNYPRTQWRLVTDVDPSLPALGHDTMRGLKQQNFWIMEQQAGPGGWELVSVMPRPGELRLWAYQSIAHGADGVVFFRWRTARSGTEEYWHGLLDHDATPGRRYLEIKKMGTEINKIGDTILGASLKPEVAILLSYDSRFGFQIQPNNPGFTFPGHLQQVYKAFHRKNVPVDVISPLADLSGYRLVVAPAIYVLSDAVTENLKAFVRAGGVLTVTARSGVKDEANAVVNQRLPGKLADLCGLEVEDYDSLPDEAHNEVTFETNIVEVQAPIPIEAWCDILKPTTASIVARYTQDYYAGKPAVCLNRYGNGKTIYVGVLNSPGLFEALVGWLLDLASVTPVMETPEGVEVTERRKGEQRYLFVLNHTDKEQEIQLTGKYQNLIDGKLLSGAEVKIPPKDVLVLSDERS